ncbi:uncharacterized protein EURHEDRAFT_264144 [Aspergillus ruber CBS 135680]|uniref:Secreted peptide n=1 Tax=Aspergillus ruber (strain CBS 135680) TaxID=1388766 RepID=A0A017SME1_ASPRC|nr:uncharacterized protein EURHEDRAFT_264144 [Aspergillus ruber CBS 135680]EYE97951.1 hypothetical protein EURHEDRAFT_264144 [Aspergillus ruber CBS 135680]
MTALLYLSWWCLSCLLSLCPRCSLIPGVLCIIPKVSAVFGVLRSIIPIYSLLAIVEDPPLSPDRPLTGTNRTNGTNTANIAFCIITAFAFLFLRGVSLLSFGVDSESDSGFCAGRCDYAWCFLLSVDSAVVPLGR